MVMKPFAGGLLCPSKAFPPGDVAASPAATVAAADVLRSILSHAEVSSVVPGTASVEEAEENARRPCHDARGASSAGGLSVRVDALRSSLCSRCGLCEPTCSQHLPVAMMFRAAYVVLHPAESFETWEQAEYFHLQPRLESACATCASHLRLPGGNRHPQVVAVVERPHGGPDAPRRVAPPKNAKPPSGPAWFGAGVITANCPRSCGPASRTGVAFLLRIPASAPGIPPAAFIVRA